MPAGSCVGDYAAWSYFQSLDSKRNAPFVESFQTKYGRHRPTSDSIETAYFSIYLFAAAVQQAGSASVEAIRAAVPGTRIDAPEGKIRVDPDNLHVHRIARIGQLRKDGQFQVVWSSDTPLKPDPFQKYKSQEEWGVFLADLQREWGGRWAKS